MTEVDAGLRGAMLHVLSIGRAGDGAGRVVSAAGIDCGGACARAIEEGFEVELIAEPEAGSTFGGWSGDCRGLSPRCRIVMDRPRTATAAFDRDRASLSITLGGTGSGIVDSSDGAIQCPPICTASFHRGASVTLAASPDPSSAFDGWLDDPICSGTGTCTIPTNAPHAITAVFTRRTHRITVAKLGPGMGTIRSAGGEIDCGPRCSADLVEGTVLALSAAPDPWSRLARWSGCPGGGATCTLTANAPMSIAAELEIRPRISAGGFHTCAVLASGGLRCWGANTAGQLGYGHMSSIGSSPGNTPAAAGDVPIGAVVLDVSAGAFHTCALLRGGTVRCWGEGGDGQLGYGDTASRGGWPATTPDRIGDVPLGGIATQVAAGFAHSCALLDTGAVRCWGSSEYGQLGYGSTLPIGADPNATPANAGNVPLGGRAIQIAAGTHHTCAVLDTKGLRCWGHGLFGRLGYGSESDIGELPNDTPATAGDVPVGEPVDEVACSGAHTCGRLAGAVRCWGLGIDGRLGYGNTNDIGSRSGNTPAAIGDVPLGRSALGIAAGWAHSCAIVDGGSVRCWGYGSQGQLGYGSTMSMADTPGTVPVVVGDVPVGMTVDALSTGGTHTCAVGALDTVRCWGNGADGRLGYGTTMNAGDSLVSRPFSIGDVPVD